MFALLRASSVEELNTKRGVWWPRLIPTTGRNSAYFSCPGCGERFDLDKWLISDDGAVTPSVDHSQPIKKTDGTEIRDCLFHEWIRLNEWVSI